MAKLESEELFGRQTYLFFGEEYEVIKKYIPKSVQRFEELFNDILKNKGKVYEELWMY